MWEKLRLVAAPTCVESLFTHLTTHLRPTLSIATTATTPFLDSPSAFCCLFIGTVGAVSKRFQVVSLHGAFYGGRLASVIRIHSPSQNKDMPEVLSGPECFSEANIKQVRRPLLAGCVVLDGRDSLLVCHLVFTV